VLGYLGNEDLYAVANEALDKIGADKLQLFGGYKQALLSSNTAVKRNTIQELGNLGDKRAIELVLEYLGNIYLYAVASEALDKLGADKLQLFEGYRLALLSGNTVVKRNAIQELGNLGDKRAIELVLEYLGNEDLNAVASEALDKLGADRTRLSRAYIAVLLSSRSDLLKKKALNMLSRNSYLLPEKMYPESVESLIEILKSSRSRAGHDTAWKARSERNTQPHYMQ